MPLKPFTDACRRGLVWRAGSSIPYGRKVESPSASEAGLAKACRSLAQGSLNRSVRQFLSLGHRVETKDGVHFVFVNAAAPLVILLILVMCLTFTFASHSATPLCFLKTTWRFRYHGPAVERDLTLFGWSLWTRRHSLQQGDRAYVEPINSMALSAHPPWYRMTLWSTARSADRTVAHSRGSEGLQSLECTAEVFNEAIEKVLRRSATQAAP